MGCGTSSIRVAPTDSTSPKPLLQEAENAHTAHSSTSLSSHPSDTSSCEARPLQGLVDTSSYDKNKCEDAPLDNHNMCIESALLNHSPEEEKHVELISKTECNHSTHTTDFVDAHHIPVQAEMTLNGVERLNAPDVTEELPVNSTFSRRSLIDERRSSADEHSSSCDGTVAPCSQSQGLQQLQNMFGFSLSASPRIQHLQLELGFINSITVDQDAECTPRGKEHILRILGLA